MDQRDEKVFTVVNVPKEKKVNIETSCLKADIWWNIVNDKWQMTVFTSVRFLEELRAKFYPIMIQRQKKEFMELRMSGITIAMQYASKSTELSKFILNFVASKRMKMSRFEERLVFYIRNQLAGLNLYKRAIEVKQVKNELVNLENQKRKWNDCEAHSKSVA